MKKSHGNFVTICKIDSQIGCMARKLKQNAVNLESWDQEEVEEGFKGEFLYHLQADSMMKFDKTTKFCKATNYSVKNK